MTAEKPLSVQEGFNTPNEAKNACILGIFEALKEHKINELYKQIENLKDSEKDELTKYLLKWLQNPEFNVSKMPKHIGEIFGNSTEYKDFKKHIKFVNELLSKKILDKKDIKDLRLFAATKKRMAFNYWLYDDIEKLKEPEIKELIKYLEGWLKNPRIDISNLSPKLSKIFCYLTGYEETINHKNFVEGLFIKGILDKRHVIDVLNKYKKVYKVEYPNDMEEYSYLKLYQCRIIAYRELGKFQGIVFRLPDGIYQIYENDMDDRSKLFEYFMSLGFKK